MDKVIDRDIARCADEAEIRARQGDGETLRAMSRSITLSIGTNHCGVQRKMTLALERQLCG